MDCPKYPCRSCVYFDACGDNTRTAFCAGRMTKTDKKKFDKLLNGCDFDGKIVGNTSVFDRSVILNTKIVPVKDIGVNEFFCLNCIAEKTNILIRCGVGRDGKVPCYDDIGVPHIISDESALVFPVPKEIAEKLWEIERR